MQRPQLMKESLILTINTGAMSLKFALFQAGETLSRQLWGKFERIGQAGTTLTVSEPSTEQAVSTPVRIAHHEACGQLLADRLEKSISLGALNAIGHRVLHGGPHFHQPRRVSAAALKELRRLIPFNPEQLPVEIGLMEELARRYPKVPQIACFDTAFHHSLPRVAKLLPIPRKYEAKGIVRYGFHGLSYTYLMQKLEQLAGAQAAKGRVILGHLGDGASLAAVRDRQCVDTTMGFTPASGLMMSTRSGDLDPGLAGYFRRAEKMGAQKFNHMVNARSGLLGVSDTSSDVRELLEREQTDTRAAEALALFCYLTRKWIGAMSAVLGGLDTLVFSGGIGENAPEIRARICQGLEYLGIELNRTLNIGNAPVISTDPGKATVRVIRTDEELLIAQTVLSFLTKNSGSSTKDQKDSRVSEPLFH